MDTITALVTVVGWILALLGLFFAARQLQISRRATQGQFLLQLDDMFRHHQHIHIALRPGGTWAEAGTGPNTNEEWAAVEAYMGLFERLYILIERKAIHADVAQRLYGYRVGNIVRNSVIRETKLDNEANGWKDFIRLCRLFDYERYLPQRAMDILSQEK